ncbi:hypothetical protein BH09ACT10_BH09ACT10_17750 [soil metagenome]
MTAQHGQTATLTHTVTSSDTALAAGSGDLEVLATPVLLAWCEAASCAALEVDEGSTSVGTRIELEHLAASAVGSSISTTATITHVDGPLIKFQVVAVDQAQRLVANGEIRRVIVDRDRFLDRLLRVEE